LHATLVVPTPRRASGVGLRAPRVIGGAAGLRRGLRAGATRSRGPALAIAGAAAIGILSASARGIASDAPMQLDRLIFVASHEGTTEVLVQAASGVIDDRANLARLQRVEADWTDAEGRPSLHIECDGGELDLATNDLFATGDVHGRLGDGRRFIGPWLRYDRKRGIAYTKAPVEIFDGNQVMTGGGLEYHVRERRLRLMAGARLREAR
jgi:LPS export ABC transporter protein LptC